MGDGLYIAVNVDEEVAEFDWVAMLFWGTVLDEGEAADSPRVKGAAGPGWALAYHSTYELYGRDAVPAIPGGSRDRNVGAP